MDKQFTFLSRKDNAITRFDIEEKTEEFLEVKRKLGRSPKTLRTYRQSLEQFSKWYKEVGEPTLTQPVIIDYIDYLRNKDRWDEHPTSPTKKGGVTGRSLNNALRNLSSFFGYFTSIGEIRVNIVKGIGKFSQESDTFSIFTDEDVKALISAPVQRTYTGFRDYCMMLVLIDAGPRSTELTQINVSDFESKVGQITLRAETTKDKKSRILPLSRFTVRNLNKLVAFTNTDGDDPLFLTQFGERCHRDTFAKNLHNYGRRVGVKNARVSPHTFRNYFAVKYLKNGGDVSSLMRILGHTSYNMTHVYVKYAEVDVKQLHEKSSPVDSLVNNGAEKKRGTVRFK